MNSFDITGARTMLRYLGKATQRLNEREHARKKLKIELSRLKKISPESFKGFIDDLEESIADTIEAEKKILKHQTKGEEKHKRLQKNVLAIDSKLKALMKAHGFRKEQLGFLETEESQKEMVKLELAQKLAKLERQLAKAKKSKKYTKTELKTIADKIRSLKQRL